MVWENGWEIMAGAVSALLLRLGAHEVCNLDVLFGLPPASGGTGGAAAKGTFPHLWLARCHPSFCFVLFCFSSLPLLQTTAIHSFEDLCITLLLRCNTWVTSEDHFAFAGP